MRYELVEAFTESTRHVLGCFTESTVEVSEDGGGVVEGFVTGTLCLKGAENATVSLVFSKGAIEKIYLGMFPGEGSGITFSGIGDLTGELINMICGRAREVLSAAGVRFFSTIPKIAFGNRPYPPDRQCTRVVHLRFEGESIFLELKESAFPGFS